VIHSWGVTGYESPIDAVNENVNVELSCAIYPTRVISASKCAIYGQKNKLPRHYSFFLLVLCYVTFDCIVKK